MSLWTKRIHGEEEESRSPLLPDSAAPELHRAQDSSYAQAASAHPADEYPDPVKPNHGSYSTSGNSYSVSFAPTGLHFDDMPLGVWTVPLIP